MNVANTTTSISASRVVAAMDALTPLPVTSTSDGARVLRFAAPAAELYQLTLFLDARAFDWESLYQVLDQYGNTNVRTGPWDFRLTDAAPLVPAYWVRLDGQKLGLWYAQRVTLPDIEGKRFRGRLAFHVAHAGEHELTLEPFNASARLPWLSAMLEPDPEDRMSPPPAHSAPPSALLAAQWATDDPTSSSYWIEQRRKLAMTHARYAVPLAKVFDWAVKGETSSPELIPLLIAAHHMGGHAGALERAVTMVKALLDKPAWGRERDDVYGHNGDIAGGQALRIMSWAYHMLAPQLGPELQRRLLDKLIHQCDAFLTQTLLMRDYWGGSLLQDHGRQALFDLGTAGLHLWGVTAAAERWVSYSLPRLARALDAAPTDGVLPGSSYTTLYLYLHNFMWYRDALLQRTGVDLISHRSIKPIPAFVAAAASEKHLAMFTVEIGDLVPLIGGQATMAVLAAKFADADAARVHRLLVDAPAVNFYHSSQRMSYYTGLLWGFFAYEPDREPAPAPPPPRRVLLHYPESGIALFRNEDTGVALSLRCGPWLGYHAHLHAAGPCDRMETSVGAGHFGLFIDGQSILCTPDTGYAISSMLRSCMLVDGKGQIGDTGYPMSLPSMPHRGEEIEMVRWDPDTGRGVIRLNLTRCYRDESGVAHYTRQFLVGSQRQLIVRDHVVLDQPQPLSWLFQHRNATGCSLTGLTATIGNEPQIRLTPRSNDLPLGASVARTPVVWSYASASGRKPFDHVRYDTQAPTLAAIIDFVIDW